MQFLIATALSILPTAPASPPDRGITQVLLRIEGIHADEDGAAVEKALSSIPNVKTVNRPSPTKPTIIVVPLMGANYDVGDLAKTVANTKTPNRAKGAPGAVLVLSYKLREGTTAEELAKVFEPACAKLKGVDAKRCRLDAEAKKLHIRLSDEGGAKLAEIKAAFPGLELSPD